jgi:hypothetical protein
MPAPAGMPREVIRALLKVHVWCKDNGYAVKVIKDTPKRKE